MADLQSLRKQSQDVIKPINRPESYPEKPIANPLKQCIFCDIVGKRMPTYLIEENDDFIAFLDIQPKAVGHTVVAPKHHAKHLEDMTATEAATFVDFVNKIAKIMKSKLGATGYTLMSSDGVSSGQFVQHFSTHIIPTYSAENVELHALNLLQTQRIPASIMDEVLKKLKG